MPKISGISFENMEAYREQVQIPFPDGTMYDLPLITARDAAMAQTFLSRHSSLRTQHAILQVRLTQRAAACEEAKKELEEHPERAEELKEQFTLDQIEKAMLAIEDTHRKIGELVKKSHELTDEIHEFIGTYVSGTPIIELLKKGEDALTIQVLQLMLWGAAALNEEKEDGGEAGKKQNPTKEPSPTN